MQDVTRGQVRYIRVPFEENDQAKSLGARWDATGKSWFIPVGVDPILLREWWAYLDCPFEEKDGARRRGARWDKNLKKWFVPTGVAFEDFEEWWPGWVTERMAMPEKEPEAPTWHEVKGELGGTYTFSFSEDFQKSGGTAKVFFGWSVNEDGEVDDEGGPTVAIKNFYIDDESLDYTMFEREVDALRKLNGHPNIVALLDYGFDPIDRTFFIVTEYIPFSLSELISAANGGTVYLLGEEILSEQDNEDEENGDKTQKSPEENWSEESETFEEILNGLVHAYDHGIHHRDLKPGNILCKIDEKNENAVLKLCDFGIASSADRGSKKKTVSFIGTETYSPPHHKNDVKYPGARDVYSWGVIAIEILSGNKIGDLDDLWEAFEDEVKPNYPVSVSKLLEKCIALDPSKRPRDVRCVLSEFKKINRAISRS